IPFGSRTVTGYARLPKAHAVAEFEIGTPVLERPGFHLSAVTVWRNVAAVLRVKGHPDRRWLAGGIIVHLAVYPRLLGLKNFDAWTRWCARHVFTQLNLAQCKFELPPAAIITQD